MRFILQMKNFQLIKRTFMDLFPVSPGNCTCELVNHQGCVSLTHKALSQHWKNNNNTRIPNSPVDQSNSPVSNLFVCLWGGNNKNTIMAFFHVLPLVSDFFDPTSWLQTLGGFNQHFVKSDIFSQNGSEHSRNCLKPTKLTKND